MKGFVWVVMVCGVMIVGCRGNGGGVESEMAGSEMETIGEIVSGESEMKSGADSVGETVTEGADEEKEDNVTIGVEPLESGNENGTVPVIAWSEAAFERQPEGTDFDGLVSRAVEPVVEEEGTFGGSPVVWSTVNDGEFLYFYYAFSYPEMSDPEYCGYAVVGENVKMECGVHVGMSVEEAEAVIPGLYHFKWDDLERESVLDWNPGAFPNGWCQKFPLILIAEVEYEGEMPLTVGLMVNEEGTVKAITYNFPTAG